MNNTCDRGPYLNETSARDDILRTNQITNPGN